MNNSLKELFAELIAEGYSPEEAMQMINSGSTGANIMPSVASAGTSLGARGLFSGLTGLRGRFGANKALLGKGLDLSSLKNLGKDIRATQLYEGGPTVAQSANTISGIYQGGKALKGLYENSLAADDLDSLKQDIRLQVASNPMYSTYMDAVDEKTLRQMQNGTSSANFSDAAEGAMKGLPKAAIAAILGGLTGGVGGAAIGGIGSLVNSGIEGYGKGMAKEQSQLQGLYDRLKMADEEYRSMKRPAGLRSAGLQTRYFNQLY